MPPDQEGVAAALTLLDDHVANDHPKETEMKIKVQEAEGQDLTPDFCFERAAPALIDGSDTGLSGTWRALGEAIATHGEALDASR